MHRTKIDADVLNILYTYIICIRYIQNMYIYIYIYMCMYIYICIEIAIHSFVRPW